MNFPRTLSRLVLMFAVLTVVFLVNSRPPLPPQRPVPAAMRPCGVAC